MSPKEKLVQQIRTAMNEFKEETGVVVKIVTLHWVDHTMLGEVNDYSLGTITLEIAG